MKYLIPTTQVNLIFGLKTSLQGFISRKTIYPLGRWSWIRIIQSKCINTFKIFSPTLSVILYIYNKYIYIDTYNNKYLEMVQISPKMYIFDGHDLVRTVPSRSTVIISCHQDFCDEFKIHDKENQTAINSMKNKIIFCNCLHQEKPTYPLDFGLLLRKWSSTFPQHHASIKFSGYYGLSQHSLSDCQLNNLDKCYFHYTVPVVDRIYFR